MSRQDDAMRTRLRALLASLQPAELVLMRTGLSPGDPGVPSSTTLKVQPRCNVSRKSDLFQMSQSLCWPRCSRQN